MTKKMTGTDIRTLREGLDLSTVQFGKLMGLGPSAVTRWESKKGNAVRMDPFAGRVAEIIIAQSKRLGKTKFGKIVADALAHEHELYALWQILGLAFGETVRVVRKVVRGGGKKEPKGSKRTKRLSRKATKRSMVTRGRIRRSRAARASRPARRAARAKRAAKAAARPAKAKRARRVVASGPVPAESKVTPSSAKEAVESRENGVQ